jgi:hypothetical protein
MHRVAVGSIKIAVSAVNQVRNVSLFEALAKLRPPTIAQHVIQDDSRRNLVLTALSTLANDRTVTTRAPASVKASAMPIAIRGSSSQMRIEQPARLELFMGLPPRG